MAVALAGCLCIAGGTLTSLSPAAESEPRQTRLVLRFEPGLGSAAKTRVRDSTGVIFERSLLLPRTEVVTTDAPGARRALRDLGEKEAVAWAERDHILSLGRIPNDPEFPRQSALARVGAPAAWDRTTGDPDNTLAIVDSGVDATHPDLTERLGPGESFLYGDLPPGEDASGHGTFIAGIAGASSDNALFGTGMDWQSTLVSLRACYVGGCWSSDVADAATFAGQQEAVAVNLSMGSLSTSNLYEDVFWRFPETLYVAGAGNDGVDLDANDFYPCESAETMPNVICVSALQQGSDELTNWSNFGHSATTAAPGDAVLSTRPGGQFGASSGTSFAAPFVTGAAGLLAAAHPEADAAQLRDAIEAGKPNGSLIDGRIGSGTTLDVPRSLDYLDALTGPPSNEVAPVVAGRPQTGHRLTAWPGVWHGGVQLGLRWERNIGGVWTTVAGASGEHYELKPSDANATLRTVVTGSKGGQSLTVRSEPVGPIDPTAAFEVGVEESRLASLRSDTRAKVTAAHFLGDVNGDGFNDIAVSSCTVDSYDRCERNTVHVILGPVPTGAATFEDLSARQGFRLTWNAERDEGPFAVSRIGDFNGDGYDDIAIGHQFIQRAWVVFGSRNPENLDLATAYRGALELNGYVERGVSDGAYTDLGSDLAPAGDVNADGYADLIVGAGAERAHQSDWFEGATYVVFGGPTHERRHMLKEGVDPSVAMRIGGYDHVIAGFDVAGIGDRDGDGFDDVAISVPPKYAGNSCTSELTHSKVFIVPGEAEPDQTTLAEVVSDGGLEVKPMSRSGQVQIAGGDVNGDGRGDLVAGADYWPGSDCGEDPGMSVLYGDDGSGIRDISALGPPNGFRALGPKAQSTATSVDAADLNGDGIDDAITGSPDVSALSRSASGAITVVAGGASVPNSRLDAPPPGGAVLIGEHRGDRLGTYMETGDLDGNGSAELIATTRWWSDRSRIDIVSWDRGMRPQLPPEASLTSSASEVTPGQTVQFDASASTDHDGVIDDFSWDTDGDGAYESGGATNSSVFEEGGRHEVRVRAHDDDGGIGNASVTVLVDDPSRPQATLLAPPPRFTSNRRPPTTFRSSTPSATFRCRVDGSAWVPCSSPFMPATPLTDGAHEVEVQAGAAGSWDVTPTLAAFTVDTEPPDTEIHQEEVYIGWSTARFRQRSDEVASFQCRVVALDELYEPVPRVDGIWWPCGPETSYIGLTNGRYVYDVRAIDRAGNVDPTPDTREFTIDAEDERIRIEDKPPEVSPSSTAHFSWVTPGRWSEMTCRLDERPASPCESPTEYTNLADGRHAFSVEVKTSHGYSGVADYSWTVDTSPPETRIQTGPRRVVKTKRKRAPAEFFVVGVGESGGELKCWLDGKAVADQGCMERFFVRRGHHRFEAAFADRYGRIDPSPAAWEWRVKRKKRRR